MFLSVSESVRASIFSHKSVIVLCVCVCCTSVSLCIFVGIKKCLRVSVANKGFFLIFQWTAEKASHGKEWHTSQKYLTAFSKRLNQSVVNLTFMIKSRGLISSFIIVCFHQIIQLSLCHVHKLYITKIIAMNPLDYKVTDMGNSTQVRFILTLFSQKLIK